jgi:predicted PurR-regulated permease PerM
VAGTIEHIDRRVLGIIVAIFFLALIAFWELLGFIIIGASFAIVLLPAHRFLGTKIRPWLSSALITAGVCVAALLAIGITLLVFSTNFQYLVEITGTIANWIIGLLGKGGENALINDIFGLESITKNFFDALSSYVLGKLAQLPLLSIELLILFLSLYLCLLFGDHVVSEMMLMVPEGSVPSIRYLSRWIVDTLYAIYVVHVIIALVVLIVSFPFFSLLGYGHILFYSIFAGILALIPIFGPVFLIAFLVVYAISIGDYRGLVIIIVIGWPALCAIPDWWMRPVLMGKRASLNAVLMFMAFFGGLAVMGLLGFILGPILVVLMYAGYRILAGDLQKDSLVGPGI